MKGEDKLSPPAASGGPSAQKPIVPGAQGARLCGRDTAASDKRDTLLNPRPVVQSSPPSEAEAWPAGSQEGLLGQ